MTAAARCALLVLTVLAAVSMRAGAQATATLRGTVYDDTGHPLADADVAITPTNRHVRTGTNGEFVVSNLEAGKYSVRVRRIGFEPGEAEVVLQRGGVADISVELTPRPTLLDTVAVNAAARCEPRAYIGFLCRMRTGRGVYLDAAAIDSANVWQVGELFIGQKGFTMAVNKTGLKYPVATSGWHCTRVLVDGRPPDYGNPAPLYGTEIIGVELYANHNDAPEAYQQFVWGPAGRIPTAPCSLIVYWTGKNAKRR